MKRLHDKVSKYLIDTWYSEHLLATRGQMAVNIAMARLINWPDTLEELRAAKQNEDYRSAATQRRCCVRCRRASRWCSFPKAR